MGEKERMKREKVMVAVLGIILAGFFGDIFWPERGLFDGNRFLKSD